MNKYSAIIADDEKNLCAHLESLLNKLWPELQIIGTVHSGAEALSLIEQEEPDIAFLDIKMPVMSGIKVAMHSQGLCHVVFITAYNEFAIQAFEHDAIDYVLKPVTEDRLLKTIERLKNSLSLHEQTKPDLTQLLSSLSSNMNNVNEVGALQWIRAGKADKTILVAVAEVMFFRASDKYTSVVTEKGEYLIRRSIKELINELDKNKFWQINRGIIVNVNYVESTSREQNGRCEIRLKNNKATLIVSRKYSHLFKQM